MALGAARGGHGGDEVVEMLGEPGLQVDRDLPVVGRDDPEALALDLRQSVGEPLAGVRLVPASGVLADLGPGGVPPPRPVGRRRDADAVADDLGAADGPAARPLGEPLARLGADDGPGGHRLGGDVAIDGAHRDSFRRVSRK